MQDAVSHDFISLGLQSQLREVLGVGFYTALWKGSRRPTPVPKVKTSELGHSFSVLATPYSLLLFLSHTSTHWLLSALIRMCPSICSQDNLIIVQRSPLLSHFL